MLAYAEQLILEPQSLPARPQPARRRLSIVVIDDSPTFMEVICALLESEDDLDVVARGTTGIEAIEMVSKLDPDFVLMDIDMPRLDGLNAAVIITCCFPHTRVMLMSAEDSPELRADCRACGAAGFIAKPRFRQEFPRVLHRLAAG